MRASLSAMDELSPRHSRDGAGSEHPAVTIVLKAGGCVGVIWTEALISSPCSRTNRSSQRPGGRSKAASGSEITRGERFGETGAIDEGITLSLSVENPRIVCHNGAQDFDALRTQRLPPWVAQPVAPSISSPDLFVESSNGHLLKPQNLERSLL